MQSNKTSKTSSSLTSNPNSKQQIACRVTRKATKKLQKQQHHNQLNAEIKQNKCSICLQKLETNNIRLPCEHRFCLKCLARWWRKHKTCPYCRKTFEYSFNSKGEKLTFKQLPEYSSDEEDYIQKCEICCMNIEDQIMLICYKCRSIFVHMECIGRDRNKTKGRQSYFWLCEDCKRHIWDYQSSQSQQSDDNFDYSVKKAQKIQKQYALRKRE